MQVASLDSLLPEDHRARLVWEYVQRVDLSRLYEQVRAVEGQAGRDAIDPRILMAPEAGPRSSPAPAGRQCDDCRVASTDGHGGGEGDLQGAVLDGRVCECD